MSNEMKRSISLESQPLKVETEEVKDTASVYDLIGFQIAKIAEGGSVAELRRIVQLHMPKTLAEATAYVKQMERIRFAGEVTFQSAQELMGSIPG